MSTETWTLVGVVAGAVLAGVWQLVAGTLQRRHEKTSSLRAARREVYVRVMRQLSMLASLRPEAPTLADIAELKGYRALWNDHGPGMRKMRRALKQVEDGVVDVWELSSELRLVAPVDTYEAGRDAMLVAYYWSLGQRVDATIHEQNEHLFYEQRDEFVRLAKRDLEIPPDERPVQPVHPDDPDPSS